MKEENSLLAKPIIQKKNSEKLTKLFNYKVRLFESFEAFNQLIKNSNNLKGKFSAELISKFTKAEKKFRTLAKKNMEVIKISEDVNSTILNIYNKTFMQVVKNQFGYQKNGELINNKLARKYSEPVNINDQI